ncbi:MAG TPA: substrate-binding domain-containing protein [Anaerolineaceae bacterium]|jgi:DNA-binding LacI/PurR family transcriptional regulator
MSKKNVQTIADIARLAQVSKSTVSRALNDSPLLKDETKDRIRGIAREQHFQVNVPARQLSRRQSSTIAYVTHAYHKDFSVADLFGTEIMGGISRGLYEDGYDMLVLHVNPHETSWIRQYLDTGRVDGFILMTSSCKQSHIESMLELDAPFIAWGMPIANACYCSVTGDNFSGGKLATNRLIETGRQQIAFLGGPADELEVQQRFRGYETALRQAGRKVDPALVAHGDFSITSGTTAMQRLLEQTPGLDGVFVNSDLMAISAMNFLRAQGRRIPEDVGVIGYDDLSIAELNNPPLTTIRQNIPQAGRLLAHNLIQYLQTGMVSNVTIPVELIVRHSA